MSEKLANSISILEKLVSFPSLSGRPTHQIVDYISDYLSDLGVESTRSFDSDGLRANLFASIGPNKEGGVLLNGHTDVVPVDGQNWQSDPFALERRTDRLYGRGAVDMKGFLACVLASVPEFQNSKLEQPIHLAFTFDEEIGGFGMPVLLKDMQHRNIQPKIVIVGEPTGMQIITGQKGGYEMRTEVSGVETHSCDPRKGVNAINYAVKIISKIEEIALRHAQNPIQNSRYDPPYATFNVGKIDGGMARNATAGWCNFDWEIRPLPGQNGEDIVNEIKTFAAKLRNEMQKEHATADIKILTQAAVPPLDDRHADAATEFVSAITGLNSNDVVSFASDAGYFSDAKMSTVIFGPGSIDRAHKPDEYITISELNQGLDFFKKMTARLST